MATTSIIVNSTDTNGKSAQKAMTCVNPDATNAQLVALGQMITAASNNTYVETFRINKVNCDLEADAPGKPTPTLTASVTTFSAATFTEDDDGNYVGGSCNLTYSGDGDVFLDSDAILTKGLRFRVLRSGSVISIRPYYAGTAPTWPVTFKVGFTETANYAAASVDITITA